jgi:ketosteroid isomerase-like protein
MRRISIFGIFPVLCWAIGCASVQQRQAQVLDTESRRFSAMIRADTARLAPLLATDMLYVHSNALTEDKMRHLQAIVAGRLRYTDMERTEAQVRLFGKTALVNGTAHVKGFLEDKPFDLQLLYSAVYRQKKKIWQLVSWQSTRLTPSK